jgi:hypothetical protein
VRFSQRPLNRTNLERMNNCFALSFGWADNPQAGKTFQRALSSKKPGLAISWRRQKSHGTIV